MGDGDDIIAQYEDIRDNLMAYVYGVWDHIKNGDEGLHDHEAENLELVWVGALPGVRESRRLMGDYILTENDIFNHRIFDDAVCYGGWCVDMHAPRGVEDIDKLPSDCGVFQGVYTIPYRSYYSKNIRNLFMAGRNISTSRMGLASTRIIGCCAIGGEAVGIAASLCVKHGCEPRELMPHIGELQQKILKEDGFLPGFTNQDEADLARKASITATYAEEGGEPKKVAQGISRKMGDEENGWVTRTGESLTLALDGAHTVSQVRMTFESNFKYPIRVTMAPLRQQQQRIGVPPELVRDYLVELLLEGEVVASKEVTGNFQRLSVCDLEPTQADAVRITVQATNGDPKVVVHEVRVY